MDRHCKIQLRLCKVNDKPYVSNTCTYTRKTYISQRIKADQGEILTQNYYSNILNLHFDHSFYISTFSVKFPLKCVHKN